MSNTRRKSKTRSSNVANKKAKYLDKTNKYFAKKGLESDKFDDCNNKKQPGFNDISWYTRNPGLVESTCRLPFANPAGSQLWLNDNQVAEDQNFMYSPGIFTFNFVPGPGVGTTDSAPINKASQLVYANMRMANSGSTNYDPVDLMMYIMAVDSAYMFISYLQRVYGTCFNYKSLNRYYPQALLTAMRVSPDIANDMPELATLINESIAQVKMFAVPADFDIITRHAWMSSNIYKDDDGDKAQIFMYVPTGYYTYDEPNGKLVWHSLTDNMTVAQLRTIMDSILTPLFLSQSAGLMSGDLQKAYSNNLFTMSPMPLDYSIDAVKNDNVLIQMMNANSLPTGLWDADAGAFDIILDRQNNRLNWQPSGPLTKTAGIRPNFGHIILNSYNEDVSANEVMEMTRLVTVLDYTRDEEGVPQSWYVKACGTELIYSFRLYTFTQNSAGEKVLTYRGYSTYNGNASLDVTKVLQDLGYLEMFDWHPVIMYFTTAAQPYMLSDLVSYHLDLDNYTIADSGNIAQIHNVALYSLFGITS